MSHFCDNFNEIGVIKKETIVLIAMVIRQKNVMSGTRCNVFKETQIDLCQL